MRSVFVNSGLFDVWNTNSTSAVRGDVYLNDNSHTAMCQSGDNPDTLSEFSINEFGEVYGGQRGDQNGWESHITNFYNYPWNCTLHYNGKADGTSGGSGNPSPAIPADDSGKITKGQPTYAVYTAEHGWLDTMKGLVDTGGGNDDYAGIIGVGIRYLAVKGVGKYRVCTKDNGWLPYVTKFDKNDEENGMAGDGSSIVAVEIPSSKFKYQVHTINGGWYSWMKGLKDTGGSSDSYAGDKRNPIDAIRIVKA